MQQEKGNVQFNGEWHSRYWVSLKLPQICILHLLKPMQYRYAVIHETLSIILNPCKKYVTGKILNIQMWQKKKDWKEGTAFPIYSFISILDPCHYPQNWIQTNSPDPYSSLNGKSRIRIWTPKKNGYESKPLKIRSWSVDILTLLRVSKTFSMLLDPDRSFKTDPLQWTNLLLSLDKIRIFREWAPQSNLKPGDLIF